MKKTLIIIGMALFALLAVVLGVILFLAGFICEMISRNSQDRNQYNVKETLG